MVQTLQAAPKYINKMHLVGIGHAYMVMCLDEDVFGFLLNIVPCLLHLQTKAAHNHSFASFGE